MLSGTIQSIVAPSMSDSATRHLTSRPSILILFGLTATRRELPPTPLTGIRRILPLTPAPFASDKSKTSMLPSPSEKKSRFTITTPSPEIGSLKKFPESTTPPVSTVSEPISICTLTTRLYLTRRRKCRNTEHITEAKGKRYILDLPTDMSAVYTLEYVPRERRKVIIPPRIIPTVHKTAQCFIKRNSPPYPKATAHIAPDVTIPKMRFTAPSAENAVSTVDISAPSPAASTHRLTFILLCITLDANQSVTVSMLKSIKNSTSAYNTVSVISPPIFYVTL